MDLAIIFCVSVLANIICACVLFKYMNKKKEPEQRNTPQIIYTVFAILVSLGITAFIALFYTDNSLFTTIKMTALIPILWAVAFTDYKLYLIPNVFIITGLVFRVLIMILELITDRNELLSVVISESIAAGAMLLVCLLCTLVIKNSIGFGDIKLFIVMGFMLGFEGITGSVFVSLIIIFVESVVLLLTKKKSKKDKIPFAPAIMLGTYISMIITGR